MEALRSEKVTVNLTPEMAGRLRRLAQRSHWTTSTAAAILIARGLEQADGERGQAHDSAA